MTYTITDYGCNPFGIFHQGVRIAYLYAGYIILDQGYYIQQDLSLFGKRDVYTFNWTDDKTIEAFEFLTSLFQECVLENHYINPELHRLIRNSSIIFNNKSVQYCKTCNLDSIKNIQLLKSGRIKIKETPPKTLQGLWYV